MRTYKLVAVAFFAAAAALFQLLHGIIGISTGFGMTVDLVGLPVLLAFFILGFDSALAVCVLVAIIITISSPETWIGASMKFAATLPMILAPALWLLICKEKNDFGRVGAILLLSLTLPVILFVFSGLINTSLRPFTQNALIDGIAPILGLALASLLISYLWQRYGQDVKISSLANPWTAIMVTALALLVRGVSTVVANYYYAGPIFFGITTEQFMATVPWYLIFGWNAIQGIIEMAFAWTIAFKFKFAEYYGSS